MKILTQNDWTFEALKPGFLADDFYLLWRHRIHVPCKVVDVEIDRILTGFFNVSMPAGYDCIIYENGTTLGSRERHLLEIYFEEEDKMLVKRVFYFIVAEDGLAKEVQFYLRWSDVPA